jgi:nucleotide-binding universal stress UspA family protein
VLGTRGLAGVRGLLGSTTRRVLERAPCAVLVVHADDGERALRPTRVLAATDFSPGATAALLEASRLLGAGAAEPVTLLYVAPPPAIVTAGMALPTPPVADRLGDVRWRLANVAEQLRRAGMRVEPELREGAPAPVIVAAARERRTDLVVLGTRGLTGLAHLLLGSTAEQVALRAGCPVLVVPQRRVVVREVRPVIGEPAIAAV